jgi:hypothetical protein
MKSLSRFVVLVAITALAVVVDALSSVHRQQNGGGGGSSFGGVGAMITAPHHYSPLYRAAATTTTTVPYRNKLPTKVTARSATTTNSITHNDDDGVVIIDVFSENNTNTKQQQGKRAKKIKTELSNIISRIILSIRGSVGGGGGGGGVKQRRKSNFTTGLVVAFSTLFFVITEQRYNHAQQLLSVTNNSPSGGGVSSSIMARGGGGGGSGEALAANSFSRRAKSSSGSIINNILALHNIQSTTISATKTPVQNTIVNQWEGGSSDMISRGGGGSNSKKSVLVESSSSSTFDISTETQKTFQDAISDLRKYMKGPKSDTLILLSATALITPLCKIVTISPILGFLASGMLVGPNGFGVISGIHTTETLAELGIVFFLFEMGIELSVERLKSMKKDVFGLGLSQYAITAGVIGMVARVFGGLSSPASIVVGGALSLSSSAFVLQLIKDKKELATRFGKASFGVLLLQDLGELSNQKNVVLFSSLFCLLCLDIKDHALFLFLHTYLFFLTNEQLYDSSPPVPPQRSYHY